MDSRIALRKRQLDQMKPPPTSSPVAVAATADGESTAANAISPDSAVAKTEAITSPAQAQGQVVTAPTVVPIAPIPAPALAPPLHPSLPPRPVISPAPFGKSQNGRNPVSTPVLVEAEAAPAKIFAPPAPKVDERLTELNDVCSFSIIGVVY